MHRTQHPTYFIELSYISTPPSSRPSEAYFTRMPSLLIQNTSSNPNTSSAPSSKQMNKPWKTIDNPIYMFLTPTTINNSQVIHSSFFPSVSPPFHSSTLSPSITLTKEINEFTPEDLSEGNIVAIISTSVDVSKKTTISPSSFPNSNKIISMIPTLKMQISPSPSSFTLKSRDISLYQRAQYLRANQELHSTESLIYVCSASLTIILVIGLFFRHGVICKFRRRD